MQRSFSQCEIEWIGSAAEFEAIKRMMRTSKKKLLVHKSVKRGRKTASLSSAAFANAYMHACTMNTHACCCSITRPTYFSTNLKRESSLQTTRMMYTQIIRDKVWVGKKSISGSGIASFRFGNIIKTTKWNHCVHRMYTIFKICTFIICHCFLVVKFGSFCFYIFFLWYFHIFVSFVDSSGLFRVSLYISFAHFHSLSGCNGFHCGCPINLYQFLFSFSFYSVFQLKQSKLVILQIYFTYSTVFPLLLFDYLY